MPQIRKLIMFRALAIRISFKQNYVVGDKVELSALYRMFHRH